MRPILEIKKFAVEAKQHLLRPENIMWPRCTQHMYQEGITFSLHPCF